MQDIDDKVATARQRGAAPYLLDKHNGLDAERCIEKWAGAELRRAGWGKVVSRAAHSRDVDAVEPRLRGLAALLTRCAEGEPQAVAELRHWDGDRLHRTLTRMLEDPERVRVALDRLLADLAGGSGAFLGGGEAAAQDWLFARLRRAVRETGGMPVRPLTSFPPRPAPPSEPEPEAMWPAPEPTATARPAEPQPTASVPNPRLRPPQAPVRARRPTQAPRPTTRTGRAARWFGVAFLLLAAAATGLAGSIVAVRWLDPEPQFAGLPPAAQTPPPAVVPEPQPAPEPAAGPAPAAAPVGPPLAAADLPVVAAPVIAQPPAPPAPGVAALPRIVIHHGLGEESASVAEQLATQLRTAGYGEVLVRAVNFDVATASVRYFFLDDRAGAERLVRALGPFLSWHGRAAPSTPIGFTDFRPLPRPGTLEIWLPRR